MKIEISQEHFGTLCICALRYCHGRQTYMPRMVQDIVKAHFKDLSEHDLRIIAQDKDYQTRFNLWGDLCDRRDWSWFYESLENHMKDKSEQTDCSWK